MTLLKLPWDVKEDEPQPGTEEKQPFHTQIQGAKKRFFKSLINNTYSQHLSAQAEEAAVPFQSSLVWNLKMKDFTSNPHIQRSHNSISNIPHVIYVFILQTSAHLHYINVPLLFIVSFRRFVVSILSFLSLLFALISKISE